MKMLTATSIGEVNLPTLDVKINLESTSIDPRWAFKLPMLFATRKRVLPLSKIQDRVVVACLDQHDSILKQAVERHLGQPCTLVLADSESLQRAIQRVYSRVWLDDCQTDFSRNPTTGNKGRSIAASKAGLRRDAHSFDRRLGLQTQPQDEDKDNPVTVCDQLIQAAVLRRASDIHLIPDEHSMAVHFRVDGQLELYDHICKTLQPAVTSRFKVLSGMDIAEKRAAQDGRMTAYLGDASCRLEIRAASIPTRYGERLTLRLLSSNSSSLTLQSLGLGPQNLERFVSNTQSPHGLILLTGPTGSGKSTTLYVAIEQLLKTRGGNVITIEDPVEYEIPGASQIEVDSADKVSFSKALRSVLRHDPDVVMIGEIRDQETANTAIKASLTGHLVFSTLHTNTAAGVITRLADMGVEPYLIAATLRLSIAQRLVRKLCPVCRFQRQCTEQEAAELNLPELVGSTVFDPVGCLACAGKGFVGRVGLFEIFENCDQISKLISEQANESAITQAAREFNARSLLEDGVSKIIDGTTTLSEVLSAVAVR